MRKGLDRVSANMTICLLAELNGLKKKNVWLFKLYKFSRGVVLSQKGINNEVIF